MHHSIRDIDYYKPTSIDEALQITHQFCTDPQQKDVKFLAGGTDLIPNIKDGNVRPGVIVEITDIGELRGITQENDQILIKAGTPFDEIVDSPILQKTAPVLVNACGQIGGVQIRNRATIGGNLVNASPSGDSIPPLFVLKSRLHIASLSDGKRVDKIVPIEEFFIGAGKTILRGGELLTAVSFPVPDPQSKGFFMKLGQRRAMTISKVSIALLAKISDSQIDWIRIALGAVAPTVIRARNTESFLSGKNVDDSDTIQQAMEIIKSEVSPIDDIRSYAWYRREMCAVLLKRGLLSVKSG
ncbi:xanthine dehydrogenase family protein subunit M [Candidatus Sumerlaeota bacterium]|nr:xanthine dehydrogenase family protein subunit M [Candidatus Sumerlaeota bacterium]